MRASQFYSKLLLSVFILPAFLSANSISLENEIEKNEAYFSDNSHGCANIHQNCTVFASYRNNRDLWVPAKENVIFNVKNANKGDGICYQEDGTFLVKKSGFYIINYGVASIGTAGTSGASFGFNLIRTREGCQAIVDSLLTNNSSAVVVFLKEHDSVAIVSQRFGVSLVAGSLPPRTTSLTDTAHISFVKLDCKTCQTCK